MRVLWMFFHITNYYRNRLFEHDTLWNVSTIQGVFLVLSKKNAETIYHSSTEILEMVVS